MTTLQADDQINPGLYASCFDSKIEVGNGLGLGIIALTFVASLECPFAGFQSSQALASTRSGRTRDPDGMIDVISSRRKEKLR